MRFGTPWSVMMWGLAVVTVLAPVAALLFASNAAVIPLVFAETGAVAARIFWRWRTGPYRDTLVGAIGAPGTQATDLFVFISGVAVLAGTAWILPASVLGNQPTPCLCHGIRSVFHLASLALGALICSSFASFALVIVIAFGYRLTYRARP